MSSCEVKILDGYHLLATKLYSKTGQGEDKNFLVSPFSMVLSFSMLCAGTKSASESELKHLIHCADVSSNDVHKESTMLIEYINSITSNNVVLNMFNRICLANGLNVKAEFSDFIKNTYKNDVSQIDFSNLQQAVKALNDLAGPQFKRLISEYSLNSSMKMLLLNAVYFKGGWFKKFDKRLTTKEKFYLMDGVSTCSVEMMSLRNRKFKYQSNAAELEASVCELPFVGDQLSMTIVLPHKHTDLVTIEAELTADVLKDILESYNFLTKVNIHIPKFKIENNLELSDTLKSMGGSHLFNGFRADFSGVSSDTQGLFLSKLFHKTIVEVDEEGTDSAAITHENDATSWSKVNSYTDPVDDFRCNRPFLFVIHDNKYRLPLMMGKFVKPE